MFRKKYHSDGILNTYKDKLVSNGFRQKEGVDYFDTYAPVATIMNALAFLHNLIVHQMDVKTIFLNRHLDEEFAWSNQDVMYFLVMNKSVQTCQILVWIKISTETMTSKI